MSEHDPERVAFGREVRQLRAQVLSSHAEARLAQAQATELRHVVGRLEDQLVQEVNGQREAIAAMHEAVAAMEAAVRRSSEATQRADEVRSELELMRASTLWRVMQPLRAVGGRSPALARLPVRAARLAWRAVSGRTTSPLPLALAEPAPMTLPELSPPIEAPASEPVPAPPPEPPLDLRLSDRPVVSVVISTFNQAALTLACLRSFAAAPPETPIEIILVDDAAPPDPASDVLHGLAAAAGVRLVRNPVNLGFLRSCNHAAGLARGTFLHFLNNDTELWPGAVDALVDLLTARPDAAMAGSKLIFPDGTLQEAGGILWDDGSAWNYGRGRDRSRPEYNYVREADYCSGASLLIRRTAFEAMNGFDEAFLPAYCEDSDLAFRLRAAGQKVLYAPRSVVVHHEGASHGTDMAQGIKAHMVTNMARMTERWRAVLAREHYPHGTNLLRARDKAKFRTVALVIDHYPLRPDLDAGSRALLGLMQALGDAGWVVKYWPENQAFDAVYTPMMEAAGIEVIDQRGGEAFTSWLARDGAALDHVVVARPETAAAMLGPLLRGTDAVLSYFGHDLHFARMRSEAAITGDGALLAAADRMERLERRVWQLADHVIYLSDDEAQRVREMAPGTDVHAIAPFCYEAEPPRTAAPHEPILLFVAGFAHSPNVDAALWLVAEILPLLATQVDSVRLVLAGSNPTDAVRALAGPGVEVTGFVTEAELAALYRRARAAVVPLRFGAGVKGKVVEALSHGLPLVTTPVGAQGLAGLDGIVPVGGTSAEIASALATLMKDDVRWLAQSHAQTLFAAERFSRDATLHSVLRALTSP